MAQRKQRDIFAELAVRGVLVLLLNSDCSCTREHYQDFTIIIIVASRANNARAERRGKIPEILVLGWEAGK